MRSVGTVPVNGSGARGAIPQRCIVFRHGNRTTAAGNFVLASGCGLRVYGNDHGIFNNYLSGITGTALTVGSGLEQDHYEGEPSDTRTGYDASERVRFVHNTIVGSANAVVGESRAFRPRDWTFSNNLIQADSGTVVRLPGGAPSFVWSANLVGGAAEPGDVPAAGYSRVDLQLAADGPLLRPRATSPAIDAASGSDPEVTTDMDGQARTGPKEIGADEYSSAPVTVRPLSASDVGPDAP